MAVEINSKDGRSIRRMVPLATLSKTRFKEICEEITIEEENEGYTLFERDDNRHELIYLLSGEVMLMADEYHYDTIAADSEVSRFAIAHQFPRQIDGFAKTGIRFFRIRGDLIQNPLAVNRNDEIDSQQATTSVEFQDDWMTALLKSPVFQLLPAFNLQQILIGLEEVQFSEGECIIEQGMHGNYYFLVRKGLCMMTRKPTPSAKAVNLGRLQDNDTFGEDSLLSGEPNHYSVTALKDTLLLRLEKEKFINLIKKPALEYIDFPAVTVEAEKGATILDIRMPDAYNKNHLDGSINIPFFSLRMQFNSLSRKKRVIVVCENGKISEAAAFFLLRNKFEALILNYGMSKASQYPDRQTATFKITGGVETVIGHSLSLLPKPRSEKSVAVHDHEEAVYSQSLKDQINILRTENEMLKKSNLQLKQQCGKLKKDKEEAENQLMILSRQTERFKEILGKIKSGGFENRSFINNKNITASVENNEK